MKRIIVASSSNISHRFKVGQSVTCRIGGNLFPGTANELNDDNAIVDVLAMSYDCYYDDNIRDVYPDYNF